MADIAQDIRTWLLADASVTGLVGQAVHQSHVPQGIALPYVVCFRATTSHEDAIDDGPGSDPFYQSFDVEVYAGDLDSGQEIAKAIHQKHNFRGAIGSGTVQGVFIEDHSDDYIPRADNSDTGRFVAALQCQFAGYEQGA